MTADGRVRTFIVCPGLGGINRGYETFARECFDSLSQDHRLELYLFKGSGPSGPNERSVFRLDRRGRLAQLLGSSVGKTGYYFEQMTFLLGLIPHLAKVRPDVVFFSDVNLRTPLWHWRRATGLSYRLLLSNGGPVGPPFPRCEHVHQVLPGAVQEAARAGCPNDRQTFIPYGFEIPLKLPPLSAAEQRTIRCRLKLPLDRQILLSVGALNTSHKRMDYVVREIASLPPTYRPFVVLLGQIEEETGRVMALGKDLLGPDSFWAGTAPQHLLADYYRAANAFVLASLSEGFGRAYVEALASGLPCLVHDYAATRFIFEDRNQFADMQKVGALAYLIRNLGPRDEAARQAGHRSAYDRFSWVKLRDRYVRMIAACSEAPFSMAEGC